jgi:fused signal recognition particle receptor
MLDFFKRKKTPDATVSPKPETSLFARLKAGLRRTRHRFSQNIRALFSEKGGIDEAALEELETILLAADVGVTATEDIIQSLQKKLKQQEASDPENAIQALEESLCELIQGCEVPLLLPDNKKPFVILMIGINGSGKTTTIGKLAYLFQQQGKKVMLAAGDTFRAAAIEQLTVWGARNNVPVVAQKLGADSASVIFDAFQAAQAKGVDVLIADTAGRLHTQGHLMEELKKVVRILRKLDAEAPHEILLVIDSTLGQNVLNQAKLFHEAVAVTGMVLTKLDGTAKGGVVFNIAKSLNLPIRFIGIGEGLLDLKPFAAAPFVSALLSKEEEQEDV